MLRDTATSVVSQPPGPPSSGYEVRTQHSEAATKVGRTLPTIQTIVTVHSHAQMNCHLGAWNPRGCRTYRYRDSQIPDFSSSPLGAWNPILFSTLGFRAPTRERNWNPGFRNFRESAIVRNAQHKGICNRTSQASPAFYPEDGRCLSDPTTCACDGAACRYPSVSTAVHPTVLQRR